MPTPEEVLASAPDAGAQLTVRGNVTAVSFNLGTNDAGRPFPTDERFILLRSSAKPSMDSDS